MCIYIYIYIHTHTYMLYIDMHIYVCIHRERDVYTHMQLYVVTEAERCHNTCNYY